MNRIITMFIFVLLTSTLAASDSIQFEKANRLYTEKQYTQAALIYEQIISSQGVAPELHYNLGNAYFRMNELGLSILNYERALRLNPLYKDAAYNLEFVNSKVVDQVELNTTFFLKKWIAYLMRLLSPNNWFILAIPLFVLALAGALLFFFGPTRTIRKSSFYIAGFLMLLTVISITFSVLRRNQLLNHSEAIILPGAIVIKAAPDKSGTDLFQLHEGTKVEVISELGEWYEIRLSNGNVGWIEQLHLARI